MRIRHFKPNGNLYSVKSNSVRSQIRERVMKTWCQIKERSQIRYEVKSGKGSRIEGVM